MKDTKRFRNIFLQIDIMLGILLVIVCGLFFREWKKYQVFDMLNYGPRMENYSLQEAELEQQISEKEVETDRNRPAAQQDLQKAKDALAQAQMDLETAKLNEKTTETALEAEQKILGTPMAEEVELNQMRKKYAEAIRRLEDKILSGESDYKICYLTFDDGPTYDTGDFLETLDKYDAKATFFTIGNLDDGMRADLMQREARAGHAVQNHTFSHGYDTGLYDSVESFIEQVDKQDRFIYQATGMHSDLVRFPAGSYYPDNRDSMIKELERQGYGWIDWCGNAFDTGDPLPSVAATVKNVLWQARQESIYVVLMHDWNGNTLEALDEIIPTLQAENYIFLPLFSDSSTAGTAFPKWD